ncbi:hypothetical protein [Pediococcus pentosaceus]|uniref:hypothetical protein n=1 Tax=Pediococcus pentosaceus TaxID=1255 RepID=UPI002F2696F7
MIRGDRYARVSLYGKGTGWIDLKDKSLPLSEEERAIIKDVQGVDDKVQAYLRKHYNDPIKIADVKGLEGCVLYPMASVVVNGDGSKVNYFGTGYQSGYYMDKHRNYLHRVVALQVLRVADPEKYGAVMRHPEKFEVHHLNPDMKSDKRVGNNALHVKVIEKDKHKKYTAIVRKLYNLKELYNVKLLKYEFYKMINNKRVVRMGKLRDFLAKKDTNFLTF